MRGPLPFARAGGAVAVLLLVAALLGGCSDAGDGPAADPSPAPAAGADEAGGASAAGSTGGSPDGATSESATPAPPPRPEAGACYRLGYAAAIDPVVTRDPVPCRTKHTAQTFAVAALPTLVDGHLVAVDSARARNAPARECPKRLGGFLGGDQEALRLSMFEAVWFTPTLEEADAGANWYRCDLVVLAADQRLGLLQGRLRGVLDRTAGSERYGMCGTAEPGTTGFERVACVRKHAWRAVRVIPLLDLAGEQGRFPGVGSVRSEGQGPCEETGSERASDPLDFQWGYEWPTKQQWADGTTYGLCWVPDPA